MDRRISERVLGTLVATLALFAAPAQAASVHELALRVAYTLPLTGAGSGGARTPANNYSPSAVHFDWDKT
ncbi:MAG TPA: hypothetical protein VFH92_11375, partial [Phenylobacterium sp.]|nr:hypothetical protein [Phenylobacterium sp.]